ncbi:hypothetical protein DMENIID0001_168130 [Sergentomyia squamirostris]
MESVQDIPYEVYQSRKYFDLCYISFFSKFIPESRWKILNDIRLSVIPIFMLYMAYCFIYECVVREVPLNPTKLSYMIVYFGAVYQGLARYLLYLVHYEDLESIQSFMTDLKESLQDGTIVSEVRKEKLPKALQFSIWFVKSFGTSSLIASTVVFLSNAFNSNFESPLIFQMTHIPMTHDTWYYKLFCMIFQFICLIVLLIVVVGSDLMLTVMVGYIDGELRTINGVLSKLNDSGMAKNQSNDILKQVYSLHMRINAIMNNLRNILWQMSIHILVSNFIFVCMTFFITRFLAPSFGSVFTLTNVIFQLVIISYNSQILLNRTEDVADGMWMTLWYEMCIKEQKIFLIILTMAQRRKGIEASGVSTISVNTLVQILKSSLTYAAFLYTLIT